MDLIERLEAGSREVVDFFEKLGPGVVGQPLTASELPDGRPWTAKDHMTHLVQRELDFLPIARRVIADEPDPLRLEHRGATVAERNAFVNRENQAVVDDGETRSFDDLLAGFVSARAELVSLVAALSEDELERHVAVRPDRDLAAAVVLGSSDRHARAHLETLAMAIRTGPRLSKRPGSAEGTPRPVSGGGPDHPKGPCSIW